MTGWEEHRDYLMGEASELQNALTLSRLEKKPDDSAKVAELVAAGRYVLVSDYPAYCPRTDALMGIHRAMLGDFATHAEGLAALYARGEDADPDERVHMMYNYEPPPEYKVGGNSDEIPF